MERSPGLLSLLIVGLLAGGALVPHLSPVAVNESRSPSAANANRAADRRPPLHDDGAAPFVKLLAEFFKVDVSEAALVRDAHDHVAGLMSVAATSAEQLTQLDDAQFVRCFFDLDLAAAPAALEAFRRLLGPAGTCAHPLLPASSDRMAIVKGVRAFVDAYGAPGLIAPPPPEKPAALKPHLETLRDDAAASARRTMAFLKVRARARSYFDDVRFVVATVPDPIDSHAGWQFDPTMAAIEEAAGADRYVLDRFYFPDADEAASPSADAKSVAPIEHDTKPGVVLFRYDQPRARPPVHRLLVVFVVTETPTSGINPVAFSSAVRTAGVWVPPTDARPVLILGPFFSGTSQSIARALADLRPDLGARPVRLVSGSATSDANKPALESRLVSFRATVQPDSAITQAMYDYLKGLDPEIGGPGAPRIARLLESNTAYGISRDADATPGDASPVSPPPRPGRPATMQASSIELRFPLHISRLRSDAQSAGPAPAAGLVSRFRPLTLGDESRPTDQLPIFAPQTTASYVELVLSKILDTIRNEHIGIVGIMATDARDKLFLARQIARDCPNVVLFTTESDLLYEHPDYYSSMAGMLIAAPYPLYNRNQVWSGDEPRGRRQFATSSVQGVYNAMLALLNYDEAGTFTAPRRARLIEYGPPDGTCDWCAPPVWISVVGRGVPWPVRAAVSSADPASYVFAVRSGRRPARTDRRVLVPTSSVLLFLIVAAAALAHLVAARRFHDVPDRHLYVAAASAFLMMPWLFASAMAMGWSRSELAPRTVVAVAAALGGVFVALGILALARAARGAARMRRHPGWIIGLGVVCWGTYGLVRYLVGQSAAGPMFIERAAAMTNGVSPAVPVFALSAALYLWAVIELRRLARPKILPDGGREYVDAMLDGGLHNFWARLSYLHLSIIALPRPAVACVAAAAVVAFAGAGFDPIWSPLRSVDGPYFGVFVTALLTIVQLMIAAALVQFLYLWSGIAAVLERLGAHPAADAYKRMPRKLFPDSVLPRVPRLSELEEPVRRWMQLKNGQTAAPDSGGRLAAAFRDEIRKNPDVAWSRTDTWRQLLLEAGSVLDGLGARWARPAHIAPRPQFMSIAGGGGVPGSLPAGPAADLYALSQPPGDPRDGDRDRLAREEEFVVLPVVYMVRAVLARMWDNVVFVIGAILLLVVTHASYPFQMNRRLEGFLWSDVAAAVAAIMFVFIRMEHDEVLSNIQSTTPGHIKWDRDFITKLLVYGLIPVAGLFATEFPDVGGTILSWIEPVRKALP